MVLTFNVHVRYANTWPINGCSFTYLGYPRKLKRENIQSDQSVKIFTHKNFPLYRSSSLKGCILLLVSPTSIVNLLSGRVDDSSFGRCLCPHQFYLRLKINIQAEMISYFWNLILVWKVPRWSWGTLLQEVIVVSDLVFLACRMNWIGVHLHLAFIGLNTLTQCQLSNICIENIKLVISLVFNPHPQGERIWHKSNPWARFSNQWNFKAAFIGSKNTCAFMKLWLGMCCVLQDRFQKLKSFLYI